MKTISIIILTAAVTLAGCQKEIATENTPLAKTAQVTTVSSIPGVSVLKDGYPYPNVQQASGLNTSGIGWHIDLGSVSSGYQQHIPKGNAASLGDPSLYCGGIKTIEMYAGQNMLMGTLQYANDAQNLYVTYSTNPDWYITETHLYVGSLGSTPKSGGGTPSPGRFPISTTFTASTLSQDITYTIPLNSISLNDLIIAAHASVIRVDIDGEIVAKETAWAAGNRFSSNKNWATYAFCAVDYCGGGPADLHTSENGNQ